MMLTRCPDCSTAFRVTPEQLKARAGKVRCGHCSGVFNALETLEDTPPAAVTTEASAEPAESFSPALIETALSEPPHEGDPLASSSAELPEIKEGQDVQSALDILLEDVSVAAEPPASRWRVLTWSLAGLITLGLLLVQGAYVFRAELAISQPDLRPLLEQLCEGLECDIPLPRKPELVSIEASDLHPDPQRKNLLVMVATLKNRAPFAQDYPHLELTLTDIRDQPMVRKVFAPADYLPQGAEVRTGFAANGDMVVSLWLDATDIGASGYRLYLFYP